MPEITREDVRAWLQREVAAYERGGESARGLGWGDAPYVRGAARAREALAALEDAERVEWLDTRSFTAYRHRDAETGNLEHAVVVDEDRKGGRIGNVDDSLRAAIDRARGAVIGGR